MAGLTRRNLYSQRSLPVREEKHGLSPISPLTSSPGKRPMKWVGREGSLIERGISTKGGRKTEISVYGEKGKGNKKWEGRDQGVSTGGKGQG